MKPSLQAALLFGFLLFVLAAPAMAQEPTPPVDSIAPDGVISGYIVNRTQSTRVFQSIEVMLHVLDQDYAEKGMLHGQSQPDGSFRFEAVPLVPGMFYAVMGIYQGAAYYSDLFPYQTGYKLNIELPVYDSTSNLSQVLVDQMHVFFNFAADGLK
jgi:hypothetical protein